MPEYDVIVVGTGGVGSAALYHLARRGARVLGIDRFPPGHDRGSSHGQTRMIRLAYFEHPSYVPLLRRAYELWEELSQRRAEHLHHETGLVELGPPDGIVVPGVLESARQHALEVEQLGAKEVESRFRGFRVPEQLVGVFERRAGYLRVEECVVAHAQEAVGLGAELRTGVTAASWQAGASGVTVRLDSETVSAGRLVVTAGAWAAGLLAELDISFEVRRKPLFWYAVDEPVYREETGTPCFFYESPGGLFYGFPQIDKLGLKVAEHSGGLPVADPLTLDRNEHPDDRERVEAFVSDYLPGVSRRRTGHSVCMYTMTPDEHFIVDQHPEYPHVAFAAGLSGHGFKFTSVLGEVLADLVLEGQTSLPIGFLSLNRPGLRQQQPT